MQGSFSLSPLSVMIFLYLYEVVTMLGNCLVFTETVNKNFGLDYLCWLPEKVYKHVRTGLSPKCRGLQTW